MKILAQLLSYAALVALVAAPVAYLTQRIGLDTTKTWMLISTLAWFGTAPFWMGRST